MNSLLRGSPASNHTHLLEFRSFAVTATGDFNPARHTCTKQQPFYRAHHYLGRLTEMNFPEERRKRVHPDLRVRKQLRNYLEARAEEISSNHRQQHTSAYRSDARGHYSMPGSRAPYQRCSKHNT